MESLIKILGGPAIGEKEEWFAISRPIVDANGVSEILDCAWESFVLLSILNSPRETPGCG